MRYKLRYGLRYGWAVESEGKEVKGLEGTRKIWMDMVGAVEQLHRQGQTEEGDTSALRK